MSAVKLLVIFFLCTRPVLFGSQRVGSGGWRGATPRLLSPPDRRRGSRRSPFALARRWWPEQLLRAPEQLLARGQGRPEQLLVAPERRLSSS